MANESKQACAYCHHCDWYALPGNHEHSDIMTAVEEHSKLDGGHLVTIGATIETVGEAFDRARAQEAEA